MDALRVLVVQDDIADPLSELAHEQRVILQLCFTASREDGRSILGCAKHGWTPQAFSFPYNRKAAETVVKLR